MKIKPAISGAKGGSSSSRKPVEAPDSLHSIDYARILDLISEGEIGGLVNGLQSVFLDETPVANPDGTLNFKNVQVDTRVGTQDQDYIKGFPSVESELGVNLELQFGTPWTRAITNTALSAIRVRISTPMLQQQDTTNGDVKGYSVAYAIDLSTDGGTFQTVLTSAITGKTTTKYVRPHRIDLPTAASGWIVRVRRLTPQATTGSISDLTFIESFAEILDGKFRYPASALAAVVVDASQFQNIPTRAYEIYGRIVQVPSNYNPVTRAYDGIWDGTFMPAWTNNPAWVYYDLATHPRYGLGHLVQPSQVDKWSLYKIARYCDELVDDGEGGTEPRFTCNVYLQTRTDAFKLLQDLASIFRGISFWTGAAIKAVADMPEDPVYVYTAANVIDGKFLYQGSGKKARHTVAMVSWNDPSDFGRAKVEPVVLDEGIARYGINQTDIIAFGCTSKSQAIRAGRWLLYTEHMETNSVTFSVGMEGTVAQPGQVILVADPARAGRRIGGRVSLATTSTITVDEAPTVAPGDTITCVLPDAVSQERVVQTVAGRNITVTVPFDQIPVVGAVWAVQSVTLAAQRFRVLGVTENDGATYTITGIQHAEAKFAAVETGVYTEAPPITVIPPSAQLPPSDITISHREVAGQVAAQAVVTVEWTAPPAAIHYDVEWRQGQGEWVNAGRVAGTSHDFGSVLPGAFEVRVAAVNGLGIKSAPVRKGPYTVPDVTALPAVIEGVQNDIAATIAELTAAQAAIDQEILDRIEADAATAAAAAADATSKANAALSAAIAQVDVVAAQVADILEADEWVNTTVYPAGDLIQYDGKLYRAKSEVPAGIVPTNTSYWEFIGNYQSLGEAVAASIAIGHQNISDIEAESTRLDGVVARMPAGVGELATQASVVSEASTRASADAALGGRLDAVEVRMPVGSGQLATATALTSLEGRVTSAEGTLSSQGTAITGIQARMPAGSGQLATSSAVSTLDGRVSAAEGAITTQAGAITTINARLVGNVGTNKLPNASFFNNSTAGWGESSVALAVVYSPTLGGYHLSGTPGSGLRAINTPYSSQANAGPEMIASESQIYTISASVNCDGPWHLALQFFNAAGGIVGNHHQVEQASTAGAWVRSSFTAPAAPAGTAYVVWVLFATNTTSHFRVFQPQLELGSFPTQFSDGKATQGNASAITSLDGRVTTAEGSLLAVASSVTQVRAELGGGGNLLKNSGMEVDASGWTLQDAQGGWAAGTLQRDLAGNDWRPVGMHNVGYTSGGTPSIGQVAFIRSELVPVTEGRRYMLSAWIAAHRASALMQIIFCNADASVVTGIVDSSSIGVINGGGQNLNGWTRVFNPNDANAVAPAGTRQAYVRMVAYSSGQPNPFMWMVRPMLEEVGPQQSAPSKWAEGTGGIDTKYAAITNAMTVEVGGIDNRLKAKHTVLLDVGGNVSGTVSENDGTSSTFSILASVFRVISNIVGAGMEWQDGYLRIWRGSAQLLLGHTFGSGDLVFWYGPNIGAAACTKANATIWFDTAASAYFGGSLSAGVLRNAVTSTSTAGNAECVNGPFGTNGNPKVVVVSYGFAKVDTANTGTWTSHSGTVAASIQIYRKVGGGSETLVTTLNVTGSYEVNNEPGGPSGLRSAMNGSTTFTDNTAGTGDFTYRAVIVSRTFATGTQSSGTVSVSTTQSITIVSTEQ